MLNKAYASSFCIIKSFFVRGWFVCEGAAFWLVVGWRLGVGCNFLVSCFRRGFSARAFNVKDILSCYDSTRRAKPKNANQIINADIQAHLIAPANEIKDGYKAWFLTHIGEDFVKNLK
jgi:hypothetical protein